MRKGSILLLLISLCGAGCQKKTPLPCTPVSKAAADPILPEVNALKDAEAMFGKFPSAGVLPRDIAWSADGNNIAFLRDSYDKKGRMRTELWVHESKTGVENALVSTPSGKVSSFTWCGNSRIVAASEGDLVAADLDGKSVQLTRTKEEERNPTGSPDGARVAFVRDHDLFVLDLLTKKEIRLTDGGSPQRVFGEPTWLYQEEFDTSTGMGWSKDSLKLWFLDTDLSRVPFREIVGADGTVEKMPYPRPGEANPLVRAAVADFSNDAPTIAYLNTGADPERYLPRVLWHEDSHRLLVERLDRLQTVLEILLCPEDGGACGGVITERDPRFINLLSDPVLLPGGRELLFLSERSGFSQIYRVGLDGSGVRAVTEGDFTVTKINRVDISSKTVVFTANVENPLEERLYRVSLDGGDIEGRPTEPGVHEALFSPGGDLFLDTHSALNRSPRTDVKTTDGKTLGTLAGQDVSNYKADGVISDLFSIETKSGALNAVLTRPSVIDETKQYPVMVIVYGGPHMRLAANQFHPTYQPFRDALAERGILVLSVDGRGSAGRGREFEASIRLSLGRLELEDQLAGVNYLKSLPYVDPKRIGIFGWSFGGYMALSALLRSNAFAMGIAISPVVDWMWYDSAYTERYMQRPSDNPEGYRTAALPELASELDVPLLLVHGISDDNVHFTHSVRMFEALTTAHRDFESIFFPGRDHKLSGPSTRVHLFERILLFIGENL